MLSEAKSRRAGADRDSTERAEVQMPNGNSFLLWLPTKSPRRCLQRGDAERDSADCGCLLLGESRALVGGGVCIFIEVPRGDSLGRGAGADRAGAGYGA